MAGTVYLVGAGPGDPGLITRRAAELIASADVILHDRLIPAGILDEARPDAELRYVGKEPGRPAVPQEQIEEQLIDLARGGRSVVRLSGGDPFVFGRGGEEAQVLAAVGIPFEVVPGVTAGVAAPAYAGIPVTHRDEASAVAFVTGHEDPGKDGSAIDWRALAAFPGTLVLYMGVKRLGLIAERLAEAGRPAHQPVAVVERGTLPSQRTVSGSLRDIAARVTDAGIEPPAVTVIGQDARLHDALAWVEQRPLFGKQVVVTRARAQASGLADRLRTLGASVVEAPAIQIVPRPAAEVDPVVERIGEFALVCLTSPNGAALLFESLDRLGLDARSLAGATVAAIGPGTAAELRRRGVAPDVVPERSVAEALVEALAAVDVEGKPVLIARAAEARDVLPQALTERGAQVELLPLYDTVAEPLATEQVEAASRAHYVTFTSSSPVRYLMQGPR